MPTKEKSLTGYPSIDKPWRKYYTEEDLKIEVPKCTVYQNIYDRNRNYLSNTAILFYGNKISYGKLFDETEKTAKALRSIGIKKGDCVTLCTSGVPEAFYTVLACSRIGAIANFINPLFEKEQMVARINDAESKYIFVMDEVYSYIENALPETCVENVVLIPATNSFVTPLAVVLYHKSKTKKILREKLNGNRSFSTWNHFIKTGRNYTGVLDEEYEKNTPVIMVYSSGSTGASKGILLTNDGVLATNYCRNIPPDPVKRQKSFLQMIPIWFSTGIVISVIIPLINGSVVIPELKFSKESFCRDLLKYKPNMTLTATSLWLHAIKSSELKSLDLSCMECPITGGEKVSQEDEQAINMYLKNHSATTDIYKGYGMCELGGTVTSTSGVSNYYRKKGGAGYPIHNVIVSTFDIYTDKELQYRGYGEIRVCSPARMKEYYKNPEATAEFFKTDEDGNVWGCTGDIGYVDEDGEVFILGRKTDSATLDSGEHVYLFDIEDVILQEPRLSGCKVVAVEDDGQTVLVAHITLGTSVGEAKELVSRLNEICHNCLPEDECPTKYKIRDSFPVHTNGKRDVEALKKEVDGFISV